MKGVNRAFRLLALAGLFAGFDVATGPLAAAAPLIGTYALSQVPDAGGELRLQPGGRYEWGVSLGHVNRLSTGRWVREGKHVLLTPDDPQNPSGFTRGAQLSSWNDEAERTYLRATFESLWATLLDRCPLLRVKALTYALSADDPADDARGDAHPAGREAAHARAQANAAMARWAVTREGTAAWDATLREASEAIAAYHKANHVSEQAHARAGIEPPLWEPLAYPAQCLPQRPPAEYEPLPPERHPQIGVVVGDPEVRSTFLGVPLVMIFSDCVQIDAVSGPGGWTSLPVRPGRSLAAIRLSVDEADPAPIRVPVEMAGAGVVVMDINPEAGAARNLEPLRLEIAADGSLKGARGVYVR